MLKICVSLAVAFSPVVAVAQTTQQAIVVGTQSNLNVLRAGAEIQLRTLTELGSKTSRVSERFNLEVSEDVRLNGRVVIPVGTRGVGEVTKLSHKGMFGKSGKIETRLLFLRVGDQQVRIAGTVGERGKGGAAATIGGTLVFLPAGLFITGTSAVLPPGTAATGFLESDLPVVFNDPAVSVPVPTIDRSANVPEGTMINPSIPK
jgi:hypothetical protein